ncbi:hypothetical protein [Photobacterium sanguinicancri]|uniref:hypothetical protein n=1 Tax=Photobacterium sanguinicancri TaxID=875932 RepID=UPI0026E476A5|nr:hypothetical protein [Photobacterium sanguinicancri]MDO6496535.1 hypothetical protein [Photobacterium sanguinicancri]
MKKTLTPLALVGALVAPMVVVSNVAAEPVAWDKQDQTWLTQDSEHFSVSFRNGHEQEASRALDIAERVHTELLPFFKTAPRIKTQLVLVDDVDVSNGWATPVPYPQIRLYMSPPDDVSSLASNDEWMHNLLRHEYTHILQMELGNGAVKGVRHVLGRQVFLFPHALTPTLLIEGLAVYLETNKTLGYGRLESNHFEMQMRMEIAEGQKSLNQVVSSARELPFNTHYLYGAYFYDYLATTYGEKAIENYLQDYSRKIIPYFLISGSAERAFGKDFLALWQDFEKYLDNKYSQQIAQLESTAVTGQDVQTSLFQQTTATSVHGLLVNQSNGEDRPQLSALTLKEGSPHWQGLSYTKGISAMDSHPSGGLAASRAISYADGRLTNDIFIYQEESWTRITDHSRFKKVRWMPNGQKLVTSRKVGGLSELWLVDAKADSQQEKLWQGTEGFVLGDYAIVADGSAIIATLKRPQQGWNLERFDLATRTWQALTDTKATESTPVMLDDGRVMYSADYDGIYNIYVMDLANGDVEQWTSEVGGAFAPQWQPELGLVYQAYGSNGYTLREMQSPKAISKFKIASKKGRYDYPPAVTNHVEKTQPEPYSALSTLYPRSWLPVLSLDDQQSLVGASTSGTDALNRHSYLVSASWDFSNNLANYNVIYQYDTRWIVSAQRSYEFEKALKGDDKYRITSEDDIAIQRTNIFNAFEDQLSLNAGVTWSHEGVESEPTNSGLKPFNSTNEALVGLGLAFDNREGYLNVPGTGWGHYADLIVETNEAFKTDYQGQKYQAQWLGTWDLPARMTLTARLGAGYADNDAKAFRLGGVNTAKEAVMFGRDTQALRGYDDNVMRGHRYFTQRLELTSWLGRVEKNWGLYPVGLGDISGSVFVDSGAMWDSGTERKQLTGAGLQLTVEAKLGYNITLPVSFGYARGLDSELGKDKLYVQLKSNF